MKLNLLLKLCEGYEALIIEFYNSRYSRDDDEFDLGNTDWELAFKVKRFLTNFYYSITILSGVYYLTSSRVLVCLFVIARTLINAEMIHILLEYCILWN